jgi:diguanylate cyclase (GGDEF)-like protein
VVDDARRRLREAPSEAPVALAYHLLARRAAAWAVAQAERELADAAPEARWYLRWVMHGVALRGTEAAAPLTAMLELEAEARAGHNRVRLLLALGELGSVYAKGPDSLRAIETFEEAIELARSVELPLLEAVCLLNLGFCHGSRTESARYASHTRAALALFERLSDHHGIALAHNNLGGALQTLGDLAQARRHYAAAESLAAAHGLRHVEALCKAGRGGIAIREGALDEGEALYAEAAGLLEGNNFQISRHHYLLGRLVLEQGERERAAGWFRRAVALAGERGFQSTVASSLLELSKLEEAQGRTDAALATLRRYTDLMHEVHEEQLEHRLQRARQRAAMETFRARAESERLRAEELGRLNGELTQALALQQTLRLQLEQLARTDPLTGLWNRRYLREWLDAEVARVRRHPTPLCVALVDVDHFKQVNDRHGHPAGDAALIGLARAMTSGVRAGDLVARWGGEELCVVFPDTALANATVAVQNLRARIEGTAFETSDGVVRLTISAGISALRAEDQGIDEVLTRADHALYAAKRAGRNRVHAD